MNAPCSVTAFAGHRYLAGACFALVLDAVQRVMAADSDLVVGCCVGADDQVIRAALALGAARRLTVLAAFGPQGEGAWALSALETVYDATSLGAQVRFLAGGPVERPLTTRLAARTRAVVAEASALVAFFGRPDSRGTFLAVRTAVGAGLPVTAFACGMDAARLPRPGAGRWVAAGEGFLPGAWAWRSTPAHERPLAVSSCHARRIPGAGGPR